VNPRTLFAVSLVGNVALIGVIAVLLPYKQTPPIEFPPIQGVDVHVKPPTAADRQAVLNALTLQHIEQSERFTKALPPELVARIDATQAKHDPDCGAVYDVTDIPASFRVVYSKAERDGAGQRTAPCTQRPETAETFHAGADYSQAPKGARN
jgi:hypothetical protein